MSLLGSLGSVIDRIRGALATMARQGIGPDVRALVAAELALRTADPRRDSTDRVTWRFDDDPHGTTLRLFVPTTAAPAELVRLAAASRPHEAAMTSCVALGGRTSATEVSIPLLSDLTLSENLRRANLALSIAHDLHRAARDTDACLRERLRDAQPDVAFRAAFVAPDLAESAHDRLHDLATTGPHTPHLAEVRWILTAAEATATPDAALSAALVRTLRSDVANNHKREALVALARIGTAEAFGPVGQVRTRELADAREAALRALTARLGGHGALTVPVTSGAMVLAEERGRLTHVPAD